jgi:glycosyltransferase involved in cell wall biosynthesis
MTRVFLEGAPIVCLGFAEWDAELKTNQHHLMSRLAETNPVLFIESLGLRRPTASARDLRRIAKRLRRGLRPLRKVGDVAVLSPLVLPYHGIALTRGINRFLLRRSIRRALRVLRFERPVLWGYVPQAQDLVEIVHPRLVVYHCVDDIAAHDRIDTASFREAETSFARQADLVIASAEPLRARLAEVSSHVELMANVADTSLFARALEPSLAHDPALAALPRPRVVFTGAISAAKIDVELISGLARLHRDWSIALVGPVGLGDPTTDVSQLRAEPNVHFIGSRRYEELPGVLAVADVGIIPYRINELTSSVFPMKVYEYLAAGLPTVSTPLPSLADVDGIAFATDADGMAKTIERLLSEDSPARRRARSDAVQAHSWGERLGEIERELEELEWRR